ncbi:hypothetical protein [Aeromonas veronii]|uniref:hypothetical protein n=1 Tax=Aeromonas veronii TaxID=654 RepID=UPI0031FC2708
MGTHRCAAIKSGELHFDGMSWALIADQFNLICVTASSLLLLTRDVALAWLMFPNGHVSEQSGGRKREIMVS